MHLTYRIPRDIRENPAWQGASELDFFRITIRAGAISGLCNPIKNRLHYVRDVTLREDASRVRKNPAVFATIRSFAYNILRFNLADSVAQTRSAAALGGFNSLASFRLCQEN